MDAWKQWKIPIHRLTDGGGQYFFGYYDLHAADDTRHLCHRVTFMDRLHQKGDRAQVGTVPLEGGGFSAFDETAAWCFQQGSMMQFVPGREDTVLYNIEDGGGYGARMRCLRDGSVRDYGRPVSALSADGTFYLSVNMARLYNFRPGYGYAGIPDPFMDQAAPADDGVWRVDLLTGREEMLISMDSLSDLAGDYFTKGEKLCINHITVSPDGSRYVMLVRNMENLPWRTLTFTADCRGAGEPFVILDDGMASHYWWSGAGQLLFYCRVAGQNGMYTLYDETRRTRLWDPAYFYFDGHMRTSPDGRWISYDSYPDREGYRRLLLFHPGTGQGFELARLYGASPGVNDIRCDLHPRWSRDGSLLSFDSLHEGTRELYAVRTADFPEIGRSE